MHPTRQASAARRVRAACLALLLVVPSAWAAPKTDVIVLDNGDHITGEIKSLERGLLTVKTDAMGTIEIEWPRIASIQSDQWMEFENTEGLRDYGHAGAGEGGRSVALTDEDGKASAVPMDDVVRIVPLSEGSWWDRVDGHLSLGLSAASANDDRQYNFAADISTRNAKRGWELAYTGARTESTNNPISQRQNLEGSYRWFRGEHWFLAANGSLTTNDELDLNLRTLAGVGAGRNWLTTPNRNLGTLIGVAVNRENFNGVRGKQNVEGFLQADFDFFHFDNPDVDLSAGLTLYPSFTVGGRLRSEFSLSARFEIIKDLYYELSYLRSQDNKPPSGDSEQLDWSVVSSLGYKF